MSARRVVGGVGRTLIAAGVLMLLFVAYQLWGTGLSEASHQRVLAKQLHKELAGDNPTVGTTTPTTTPGAVLGNAPAEGQPVAFLTIPSIGLHQVVVVEGVGTADLRLGPGHYPGTPLPGQPGNAAIAGHRTTYAAPFYNLDKLGADLQAGRHDDITLTTAQGSFVYSVQRSQIVSPDDASVLDAPANPATAELTLTTCNPRYSASQRLVVQALLTGTPAPAPPAPATTKPHPARTASGLAGAQGNPVTPLWWGLGCLAVAVAGWLVARRFTGLRRFAVYSAAAVPFLVVLFFFYASLSPLLPASF